MWRTTLFGHTHLHPAPANPLMERLHGFTENIVHTKIAICRVCCAELQPDEAPEGMCRDTEACAARHFAQRCW